MVIQLAIMNVNIQIAQAIHILAVLIIMMKLSVKELVVLGILHNLVIVQVLDLAAHGGMLMSEPVPNAAAATIDTVVL
jgi:hypothetical protein